MSEPVVNPDELKALDVTIAEFVLPRLKAFRATTTSYPEDLDAHEDGLAAWHAELDRMIAGFEVILSRPDPLGETTIPTTATNIARMELFGLRLHELWI